ncbi:transposase [Pseudoroseomonas sp. WGS1072]|uniref:transposase n=1 Tax=Roseomonas sp. WGS1072 TaxID=3366816 RepID=UPI003BF2D630
MPATLGTASLKLRDLDNGIRGLLPGVGLKVGQVSEAAFLARVRELADGQPGLDALMGLLLQARDAVRTERERLHRLVLAAVREDDVCRRWMTVPGVGPVMALTFCSAVDDPTRFSCSRAVGAHCGLTPRRYQSGETDRVGTTRGDSVIAWTPTLTLQRAKQR